MKLLLDQNISPRLVQRLADLYPDTSHVALVEFGEAFDERVVQYARTHDYVIVTKDADFSDIVALRGFPPRVIWLHTGNCTTREIEMLLRDNYAEIVAFHDDDSAGTLILR